MKFLAAILVCMIAAQPVQAGFCDMDMGRDSSPDAGQQHHPDGPSDGHACCDPEDDSEGSTCSDRMHCGSCATGVAAILPAYLPASLPVLAGPLPLSGGVIAPAHDAPPYRPPILFS
jgi:hypothetical protein